MGVLFFSISVRKTKVLSKVHIIIENDPFYVRFVHICAIKLSLKKGHIYIYIYEKITCMMDC
jgi:hypothetical protein